jgi:hypothetical protein
MFDSAHIFLIRFCIEHGHVKLGYSKGMLGANLMLWLSIGHDDLSP